MPGTADPSVCSAITDLSYFELENQGAWKGRPGFTGMGYWSGGIDKKRGFFLYFPELCGWEGR